MINDDDDNDDDDDDDDKYLIGGRQTIMMPVGYFMSLAADNWNSELPRTNQSGGQGRTWNL